MKHFSLPSHMITNLVLLLVLLHVLMSLHIMSYLKLIFYCIVWFCMSRNLKWKNPVTTTITTILRAFFWDHPGEPVPEKNFWTLWCKGRLTEADTATIRLGTTPSGLSSAHLHHPIFYRPDALPATQPTVSKHWRQLLAVKSFTLSENKMRPEYWVCDNISEHQIKQQ